MLVSLCESNDVAYNVEKLLDKPVGVYARYCDPDKQNKLGFLPKFTLEEGIKIVGEFELADMNTEYVNFNDGKMLACTQALGHNSKTGYNPSTFTFKYEENSSYRVVIASDGLFDMLMLDNENDIQILRTKTSKEICGWIVDRWLHEWTAYLTPGILSKFNYKREDCDDVSVAIVEIL